MCSGWVDIRLSGDQTLALRLEPLWKQVMDLASDFSIDQGSVISWAAATGWVDKRRW
jgi:hypothetical protein